jgi:hypothetical protein
MEDKNMSDFDNPSDNDLIILVGGSILGFIGPNIREIDIEYDKLERKLKVLYFFNDPPTDNDLDAVGCVEAELIAQTGEITFESEITHLPYPTKIPNKGICVYRRYESCVVSLSLENLLIAATQAMLGRIHPTVRKIYLTYDKRVKKVHLFCCFDSAPKNRQIDYMDMILKEMRDHFSNDISWEKDIIVVPFPGNFSMNETCIYARSEPYNEEGMPVIKEL